VAGEVLRDSEGTIITMFSSKMGLNTKNGAKLEGLLRGLKMAIKKGIKSLITEGYSLMIISTLKKLIVGSNLEKLSKNWILFYGWTHVVGIITSFRVIIVFQMKRSVNSMADYLCKLGVSQPNQLITWTDEDNTMDIIYQESMKLNNKDISPPDGVPHVEERHWKKTTTWRLDRTTWTHGTSQRRKRE
jgi:hypothetical protein